MTATTAPATLDNGTLTETIAVAKQDPNIQAMAATLVMSQNQTLINEDRSYFTNLVNAQAHELGSSYPLIGSAPGAVAELVRTYDAERDDERAALAQNPHINAIACQAVVDDKHGARIFAAADGVDTWAASGNYLDTDFIARLLHGLAAAYSLKVENPVALMEALLERVRAYADMAYQRV